MNMNSMNMNMNTNMYMNMNMMHDMCMYMNGGGPSTRYDLVDT